MSCDKYYFDFNHPITSNVQKLKTVWLANESGGSYYIKVLLNRNNNAKYFALIENHSIILIYDIKKRIIIIKYINEFKSSDEFLFNLNISSTKKAEDYQYLVDLFE